MDLHDPNNPNYQNVSSFLTSSVVKKLFLQRSLSWGERDSRSGYCQWNIISVGAWNGSWSMQARIFHAYANSLVEIPTQASSANFDI